MGPEFHEDRRFPPAPGQCVTGGDRECRVPLRDQLRRTAKAAAKAVLAPLLRGRRGRDTPPSALKGGPVGRTIGAALDAGVPKNASGNNASVR